MAKQRIDIEYPLTTESPNIVWEQIRGEPWTEQDIRRANLIEYVKYDHIRLQWDEDEDEGDGIYWEMRIEKSDLTGHLNLLITDFADDDDVDGLKILWESNLDRLHRASGL